MNKFTVKIIDNTVLHNNLAYIGEIHHVSHEDKNILIRTGKAVEITQEEKDKIINKSINTLESEASIINETQEVKKLMKRGSK